MATLSIAKSSTLLSATLLGMLLACSITLSGCGANKADVEKLQSQVNDMEKRIETLEGSGKMASSEATNEEASEETITASSPATYPDVNNDVPTAVMINDLAQLNVFEGVDGVFKPYEPVTRGEYITWLFKAYNAQHPPDKQIRLSPSYKLPFSDIQPSHPAYKYVQAFTNAGFAVGYDAKNFKPDKVMTREEMIAVKSGVNGFYEVSGDYLDFTDKAAVDKRYTKALNLEMFYKNAKPYGGDIQRAFGMTKTLKPKEEVLRYEAAGTLWQTDHNTSYNAKAALDAKKSS